MSEHVTSETPAQPPQPAQPQEHRSDWARTAKWIGLALIFFGAGIYVFKSCIELPRKTVQDMGRAVADVVSAFRRGTFVTSFESYATTITNYQHLQFATLKQKEIFTETDVQSFGAVEFEGIVEARAPVEYTYYVDLNGKWQFTLRDNVIYVQAPPVRPNKPAVDVSKLTYETKKYRPFLTAAAEKRLKQNLMGLISLRAKENIPLVKETGRKQIADFVESWLARAFTDGKVYAVKVYFPDESILIPPANTNETTRAAPP